MSDVANCLGDRCAVGILRVLRVCGVCRVAEGACGDEGNVEDCGVLHASCFKLPAYAACHLLHPPATNGHGSLRACLLAFLLAGDTTAIICTTLEWHDIAGHRVASLDQRPRNVALRAAQRNAMQVPCACYTTSNRCGVVRRRKAVIVRNSIYSTASIVFIPHPPRTGGDGHGRDHLIVLGQGYMLQMYVHGTV